MVGSDTPSGGTPISWNSPITFGGNGQGGTTASLYDYTGLSILPYHTYQNVLNGTVHFKAQWIQNASYPGIPLTPPPPKLTILYSTTAHWGVGSNSTTQDVVIYDHGADDGFNDSEVRSGTYNGDAHGGHLKTYSSSSGVVEDDVSLNSHLTVMAPAGGGGSMGVGDSVALDDRGVNITSNADTTFSRRFDFNKGAYAPFPNTPDSGGVIHGDIKSPPPYDGPGEAPTITITYQAGTFGQWHSNSSYHWFDSSSGMSASGSFDATNPPANFSVTLTHATAAPGTTTHGFISCIDGSTGDKATGNEYYKFHSAFEDWVQITDIQHPLPRATNPADWNRVITINNPQAGVLTATLTQAYTDQLTESGTIGGSGSVPKVGEAALAFAANASITIGHQWTYQITTAYTFTADPWTQETFWVGKTWDDLGGTCSQWWYNGYQGDAAWTGIKGSSLLSIEKEVVQTYPHSP